MDTYRSFKEIKNFSKIIVKKNIEEADFNLSPSRFVSVMDEEKYRPIGRIYTDLQKIEVERSKTEKNIEKILKKIKN